MAGRPVRLEVGAVEAGDAGRFLAAVLERVQAERDEARGVVGTPNAENPAFLAQLVVIERIGRQHVPPSLAEARAPYRMACALCRNLGEQS